MSGYKNEVVTGKRRYRESFFGKMILQIQIIETYEADLDMQGDYPPSHGTKRKSWRDARICDLTEVMIQKEYANEREEDDNR